MNITKNFMRQLQCLLTLTLALCFLITSLEAAYGEEVAALRRAVTPAVEHAGESAVAHAADEKAIQQVMDEANVSRSEAIARLSDQSSLARTQVRPPAPASHVSLEPAGASSGTSGTSVIRPGTVHAAPSQGTAATVGAALEAREAKVADLPETKRAATQTPPEPTPATPETKQAVVAAEAEEKAGVAAGEAKPAVDAAPAEEKAGAEAKEQPKGRLARAAAKVKALSENENVKKAIAFAKENKGTIAAIGAVVTGGTTVGAVEGEKLANENDSSDTPPGKTGPDGKSSTGGTTAGAAGAGAGGKNIRTVTQAVNLPANILPESGNAASISVGSRNGELEVWCISQDFNRLMRYNASEIEAENPWVDMVTYDNQGNDISPLKSVSVSSDGTLMVLNGEGQAYMYNWDEQWFSPIPMGYAYEYDYKKSAYTKTNQELSVDRISAGNAQDIWVTDDTNQVIYKLNTITNAWNPRSNGIQVAAGIDGTVVMIDADNIPHILAGNNRWTVMPGVQLDHITVINKDEIYGSYQGVLWRYTNNQWTQIMGADRKRTSGVDQVAANAAGTLFITDQSGNIYNSGDDAVEIIQTVVPAKKPGDKPQLIKTIKKSPIKNKSRYKSKAMKNSPLIKKIADAKAKERSKK